MKVNTAQDTKIVVTLEDFETAFSKVKPSVTTHEREKFKRIAKLFGSSKGV